jgi:hypothetical protein
MNFEIGEPKTVTILDKFVRYAIQKPTDTKSLLDRYGELVKDFENCTLALSGGTDSQFMLRLLTHFNIPFKAVTYMSKWNDGIINTDDLIYAQEVCKQFNVDLEIIEIDLEQFYNRNKHMKYAKQHNINSPQVALHLEFINRIAESNNKLVMGGDMPYCMLGVGTSDHNFSGIDNIVLMTPALMLQTVKPYYDFCKSKNIKLLKEIAFSSPEAIYQILEMQIEIVKEQKIHLTMDPAEIQLRDTLRFKKAVWNKILPGDINTLIKVGGFERIKKLLAMQSGIYDQYDKLYREPMKQTYKPIIEHETKFRVSIALDDASKELPNKFKQAVTDSKSKPVTAYQFDF